MPIHLFWGDDSAARERAIDNLINKIIDPAWNAINLSRLDGSDISQASQALNEVRTPPFGSGGRVVLLRRSPFCNNCGNDLAKSFDDIIHLIPKNTHLVLSNINKPDGRLKSTKSLQLLIKTNEVSEQSFKLPTIWDEAGQRALVDRTAQELNLKLEPAANKLLVNAIGNDSERLTSELIKLSLLAQQTQQHKVDSEEIILISSDTVQALIEGMATNALQVGNSLIAGNLGEAIARLNALLDQGEPALKILATITGQVRGSLWVRVMEEQGETDVSLIAKAAGIANPKRIYIMRKQLREIPSKRLLNLLESLLKVESALKKGIMPSDAFKDGLLSNQYFE